MTPDTLLIFLSAMGVGLAIGIGQGIGDYIMYSITRHYEEKEVELS